jgi:hypothetical protein
MKTIPQKCFRPYQKQMIVYVTIHMTVKFERKDFNQEMQCLEFIKTDFWN